MLTLRFRTALVLLGCTWVSVASAQAVADDLPSCALPCFAGLPPRDASSPICSFKSNDEFERTLSPCFRSACPSLEAISALNVTSVICDLPVRDISLAIRVFVITATAFASIIIGLRVLVKAMGMAGGVGWDDWAIVIAVSVTLIATVGQYMGAHFGMGRDMWKLSSDQRVWVYKSFYIAAIGYKLGNAWARISVLCFYLRIFGASNFRRVVIGMIVLNLLIGITFAMADSLQCRPPSFFWNDVQEQYTSHCVSLGGISWAHSILNVVMDLATLGMAIWMVRRLEMRWKKKFAVIGMFILGSAITIVSIARLQALPQLSNTSNRTWNLAPIAYWSSIEMLAGLVCACLPALKALRALFCGTDGSQSRGRSTGYQHSPSSSAQKRSARHRVDPTLTQQIEEDMWPQARNGDGASETGNSVTELVSMPKVGA